MQFTGMIHGTLPRTFFRSLYRWWRYKTELQLRKCASLIEARESTIENTIFASD